MWNKWTILFVLDLYTPHIWWVEILFENIITLLSHEGYKCIVLTSRYDKTLKEYEKNSSNIEIYRVGTNRYNFMFYSLFTWFTLAKEVDIIHTTTYNSAIPASIIWCISWKKVVLTVHEIFWKLWYKFMWWKWFFFKLFESFIFKFPFEKYICVSNYTKNSVRVYFWIEDSKLTTIYNGIDYEFWNKENFKKEIILDYRKIMWWKDSYICLFYGRSGISKWLEFYIRAIPELIKSIPNFQAFLILPQSKNNPTQSVEKLIEKLSLEKYVKIIGWVKNTDLPNYILASDCVILPSLAEWFWFAVAEVSALEHNLISTNISAIPEVVSGKSMLIEPGSSSAIVKAITEMFHWNIKITPKKFFLWEDAIEKTLRVYKEILWK